MDTDRRLISLRQEHEVRYWTLALGASRQELLEAVQAVGRSADAVRDFLKTRRVR